MEIDITKMLILGMSYFSSFARIICFIRPGRDNPNVNKAIEDLSIKK